MNRLPLGPPFRTSATDPGDAARIALRGQHGRRTRPLTSASHLGLLRSVRVAFKPALRAHEGLRNGRIFKRPNLHTRKVLLGLAHPELIALYRLSTLTCTHRVLRIRAMHWSFGLSAWIVQDGNYPDLSRGERIELAIEFAFSEAPAVVPQTKVEARHVNDSTYDVVARVVAILADAWVIDIGVLVFQDRRPPADLKPGDFIAGRVWLGVDPFFYFEKLAQDPAMPALIYAWQVATIQMQRAPWLESGDRTITRDESVWSWREIEATDAWNDNGGQAEYLLACELLTDVPKRVSATAAQRAALS